MTNDEIRQCQPVMRRATEAGCPGWTPIVRPAAEPAPAIGPSADEAVAPASVDDASPPPVIDSPRR